MSEKVDTDTQRIYRAGYLWLLAHGYTEDEAKMLATLRLAVIYYPEAFM